MISIKLSSGEPGLAMNETRRISGGGIRAYRLIHTNDEIRGIILFFNGHFTRAGKTIP
jgi:hypothetical protein